MLFGWRQHNSGHKITINCKIFLKGFPKLACYCTCSNFSMHAYPQCPSAFVYICRRHFLTFVTRFCFVSPTLLPNVIPAGRVGDNSTVLLNTRTVVADLASPPWGIIQIRLRIMIFEMTGMAVHPDPHSICGSGTEKCKERDNNCTFIQIFKVNLHKLHCFLLLSNLIYVFFYQRKLFIRLFMTNF